MRAWAARLLAIGCLGIPSVLQAASARSNAGALEADLEAETPQTDSKEGSRQKAQRTPAGARYPRAKPLPRAGAGTVDRGKVLCATKTLPSTDYKSTGRPEIVVEIRGPTTSRLLQPGGRPGQPGGY